MKEFKNFSQPIKIRIALRFLTTFSNTAVMPFVVLFFVEQIGSTLTTILTVFIGVAGIAGGLLGGKLADTYGRKKFILIGELLTAIGFLIVTLSNIGGNIFIVGSVLGFLIIYFFSSLSQPAYSAFIIDETNEENRKSVYSFMMWTAYLAFALGSATGGLLFAAYKIELFLFVGLCSLISFICVAIWIPESFIKPETLVVSETSSQVKKDNQYVAMLKKPIFLILAYISFIFALMDNQIGYYLSLRYFDLFSEQSYQLLGFLRTENTVISVVFLLWITQKLKKYKEINTAIMGAILFFIGYVLLSFFVEPIYLYFAMLIVSVGEIVLFPSIQTITANMIPDDQRASYYSVLGVFSTIGGLCASFFMILMHVLPSSGFTILFAIIGIISMLVLYKLRVIQLSGTNT